MKNWLKNLSASLERFNTRLEAALKAAFTQTGEMLFAAGFLLSLTVSYTLFSTFNWLRAKRFNMSFSKKTALKWVKWIGLVLFITALLGTLATIYVLYGAWFTTAAVFAVGGAYLAISKKGPLTRKSPAPPKDWDFSRKGWYLNIYLVNGLVIVVGLAIAAKLYFITDLMNGWILAGVTVALATTAFLFSKRVVVPKTTYGIVEFLGKRARVYVTEGKYWWIWHWVGLNISADPLSDDDKKRYLGIDASGFFSAFGIPVQIWNSAELPEGGKPVLSLTANASNNGTVIATVTANIRFFDPKKWADSENPILLFADTMRDIFRKVVALFLDRDAPALGSVYADLMTGKTILVAYNRKTRAVIRNRAGRVMYRSIDGLASGTDVNSFRSELEKEVDERDLADCKVNGEIDVQVKNLRDTLFPVLHGLGIKLDSIAVGNAQPSEEVIKQANKASGEDYQRMGQVKSAEAFAEAAKIRQSVAGEVDDVARALTGAEDNPNAVKVNFVFGGADPLIKAAATLGDKIKP